MGMNGRGMRAQFADADLNGPMHDEMVAAFAAKLGISVEDLNARLANGETMAQIATSKGLTAEQLTTLMADVRAQALDQAVKNGTLTQAQADAMKLRGGMMGQGQSARGTGTGMGAGRGGMQGQGMRGGMLGQGQLTNPNCPFATTQE